MTIKQLIKKIKEKYPYFIEDILTSEFDIYELSNGTDVIKMIIENINLNLTDKEFKILTNKLYGVYNYVNDKKTLEEYMKVDYFEWKVLDYDKFKSITQFKKEKISEC